MILNKSIKNILAKSYPIIRKINQLSHLSDIELMMTVVGYKLAMADAIIFDSELKRNLGKIGEYGKAIGLYLATSKCKYIVNSPLGILTK